MDQDELQAYAKTILEEGPMRVVYDKHGGASTPKRVFEKYGYTPRVIFLRDDYWSLGAPVDLVRTAFSLWPDDWVGVIVVGVRKAISPQEWIEAGRPTDHLKYLAWKMKQLRNRIRPTSEW
jgi:hypothetical protein